MALKHIHGENWVGCTVAIKRRSPQSDSALPSLIVIANTCVTSIERQLRLRSIEAMTSGTGFAGMFWLGQPILFFRFNVGYDNLLSWGRILKYAVLKFLTSKPNNGCACPLLLRASDCGLLCGRVLLLLPIGRPGPRQAQRGLQWRNVRYFCRRWSATETNA